MPIFNFSRLSLLYFCLLYLCNLSLSAQFDPNKKLSLPAAEADLNQAVNYLYAYHPNFPSYMDSMAFESKLEGVKERLYHNMSVMDFYREISVLNSYIHCVHTNFILHGQARTWKSQQALFPPFSLEQVGQQYYLNFSRDTALHAGDEIISIDGIPIDSIAQDIVMRIAADGLNQTRKYHALARSFPLYYTYFQKPNPSSYQVRLKRANQELEIKTKPMDYKHYGESLREQRSLFETYRISYIDTLHTAWLQQFTFRSDLINRENYEADLIHFFDSLQKKKTENLVIDLRGNGGGYSEYAQLLLEFLVQDSFEYARKMRLKTNQLPKHQLLDIPNTFLQFPQGITICPVPNAGEEYRWNGHKIQQKKGPRKNAFSGKLIILMDGGAVSTSAEFIALAAELTNAVFIGEEMGGTNWGDNGGVLALMPLTNSELTLRIPLVKYELAVRHPDSGYGIQPDIPVSTAIPESTSRFRWDPYLSHPNNWKDPYVRAVWKYLNN